MYNVVEHYTLNYFKINCDLYKSAGLTELTRIKIMLKNINLLYKCFLMIREEL